MHELYVMADNNANTIISLWEYPYRTSAHSGMVD